LSARCVHHKQLGQCPDCEAALALQLQKWPALTGERPRIQTAATIRQRFAERLGDLRTFAGQLSRLPAPYWPLLQADQAFLDSLGQELRLIAERGDALLQEETRASFWVQHQQGQTTGTELTANQRTVVLLGISRLQDVARYQPLASELRKNPKERFYRQALPRVVQYVLEWLVEGKILARWQEERDNRRLTQELQQPPPKKGQGGKRLGAGRPKGEPTRVLPLRLKEPLYLRLAALAREANLPLSVFLETWLEKQHFQNK
jgi:hypothetical protein